MKRRLNTVLSRRSLGRFSVLLLMIVLIMTGCSVIRKATYPPDFHYLDKQTVTSSMQRLAQSMGKIDQALTEADTKSVQEVRNTIIHELNAMEEIAKTLGAGTITTNHLFIDQHIDLFKSDVVQARRFIEAEPANYYMAGKLVGSCMSCHVLRPGQYILMR